MGCPEHRPREGTNAPPENNDDRTRLKRTLQARNETSRRRAANTSTALTTTPLPLKGQIMANRNSTPTNGSRLRGRTQSQANSPQASGLVPAVGYIRMSTDKQEDSPEQQRAEIVKLAKREGYRIVRWYEDHAISGAKTHKRRDFRRMTRDAEDMGDFQAILCWDQDRFGRFDSLEAGEWISPLRRVGVQLVTVVQGRINWEDFAGRIIYQITQEGKHHYLVDLSRNALRGMIRFA